MNVVETELPGVILIEPRLHEDDRGRFLECWRADRYEAAGIPSRFVQDNVAVSRRGVLRGLHFQQPDPQGKLVMVLHGAVFDVAVDIRRGSPNFGRWIGLTLSAENGRQLWIPEGFAHGYLATTDNAVFSYKCTRVYNPAGDLTIRFDDPSFGIEWPVDEPLLSHKDRAAGRIVDMDPEQLPTYPALDPTSTSLPA